MKFGNGNYVVPGRLCCFTVSPGPPVAWIPLHADSAAIARVCMRPTSLALYYIRIDSGGGGGSGSIIVTGSMGKSMNGIMLKLNGICNIGGGELDEVEGGNCWWKGDCNIGSGDVEDVA